MYNCNYLLCVICIMMALLNVFDNVARSRRPLAIAENGEIQTGVHARRCCVVCIPL